MKKKNYKVFYAVGIIIVLIGIITSVLVLINDVKKVGDDLQRIVVPTDTTITFEEPGQYTVFYENRSIVDNKIYSTGQSVSGLYCQMESPSGQEIELKPSVSSSHYSFSGYEGNSVFEFTIEEPGEYDLSAWYYEGVGREIVLAFGKGFFKEVIFIIVKFMAIGLISLIMAAIFIIIGYKKKKKFDKDGYILVD